MKILYIHQYFKTPEEGGAIRSYHVAKAMVQAGHTVDMITSHNSSDYICVHIEGINVHYLPIKYDNKFSAFRRILAFLLFLSKATSLSFKIKKDIIYATSTPLTVGAIALINKLFFRTSYIFEVRDLWPQVPIEMGFIKNSLLIGVLNKFEKLIYCHSKSIIALSPAIETAIKDKCVNVPVFMVPNFSDIEYFNSNIELQNDKIVISYIGTLGFANGLDKLIALAKVANESFNDQFEFIIMGDGAEKYKLQKIVFDYNLKNVKFLPFSNKEKVKSQMMYSDLIYVSFADFPILGKTTSPNKFFDAIAMGKVVIVNFEGWLTELILDHKAGYFQTNNNKEETLNQIIKDKQHQSVWNNKQLSSSFIANEYFDKNNSLIKLCLIIEY